MVEVNDDNDSTPDSDTAGDDSTPGVQRVFIIVFGGIEPHDYDTTLRSSYPVQPGIRGLHTNVLLVGWERDDRTRLGVLLNFAPT